MPWIAKHDGKKKGAWQVPAKTDAYCVECGNRVRVWREASDGTARHFKHIDNMGGGGGGSPDLSACELVAESDKHLKWKNFAAERLANEFEGNVASCRVEQGMDAPESAKDLLVVRLRISGRDSESECQAIGRLDFVLVHAADSCFDAGDAAVLAADLFVRDVE